MNMREMRRFGKKVRELAGGEDPDIVYEHPGRWTFATSVFVARRGGSLLLLGGRMALAEGGFGDTPLADMLPVRLGPPAPAASTDTDSGSEP